MLTRREVLLTTSAAAFCLVTARPARANWAEDIAARLQRDLDARSLPGTSMKVIRTDPKNGIGIVEMDAVVQMHWPPGMRQRPVDGIGADGEEAYQALLARTLAVFSAPNPGGFQ